MPRNIPLKRILIISLSFCMLLAVTIQAVLIFQITDKELTTSITQVSVEKLSTQTQTINQYFNSIENLAYAIANSQQITDNLSLTAEDDFYVRLKSTNTATSFLEQLSFSYQDIVSTLVLTEDRDDFSASMFTFKSNDVVTNPIFLDSLANAQNTGYTLPFSDPFFNSISAQNVFCYYHKLYRKGEHIATICIFIDTAYFSHVQSNVGNSDGDLLIAYQDDFIYAANDTLVANYQAASANVESSKFLLLEEPLSNDWKIINLVSNAQITAISSSISRFVLLGMVLAFGLYFILLIFISNYLTKSLHKLDRKMASIGVDPYIFKKDHLIQEVSMLNNQYNEMEERLDELMIQIRQEQQEKDKAHLDILRAQINPHFLYNTLDAINWMALDIDADNISAMTTSLANLFRYSLNNGMENTSVFNEIAHIDSYLNIQKHRYNNRFVFTKEIDEALLNCQTLNIILQPSIENCLVHGFRNVSDTLHILLKVFREQDDIVFIIDDDGKSADVEKLNELASSPIFDGQSYGIRNVNRRIKLRFGERYGVQYLPKQTDGVCMCVRIPCIFSVENDSNKKEKENKNEKA